MFKQLKGIFIGLCLGLVVAQAMPGVSARDQRVYDNLMRSRDALVNQRAYLQKGMDDINGQIHDLQEKSNRINDYLKQVDQALHDVDIALRQVD